MAGPSQPPVEPAVSERAGGGGSLPLLTWAALFALNISGWLQTLARTDLTIDGRAHGKRLRRELICLAARVLHRGRQTVLRFVPGMRKGPFLRAWNTLRALPAHTPAAPSG